ncbi:MAG: fibronectin type III domain-containing protein [FCB group bacterium]|nr:fibronectin type III domain-containing protein [FCB group bacterium]
MKLNNLFFSSNSSRFSLIFLLFIMILLINGSVFGQDKPVLSDSLNYDSIITASKPLPPVDIRVKDEPGDAGGVIDISWKPSPDEKNGKVKEYLIFRSKSKSGPFKEVGNSTVGVTSYMDNKADLGVGFYYKVASFNFAKENGNYLWKSMGESEVYGPVKSTAQWFNIKRLNIFIGIIVLCGAIIYFIFAAKSGKSFYIRKIAGIEEVENAVGRATEMGRSIYYIPGINDMDDVQTLASMTILGRVATFAAENDTRIDVPVSRSLVMVTAKEMVREAYSKVGRPDSFREDQVRYLTDDQFGYAAAVDGLFVREKPATIFMIGAFFAESLIIAETGNSIGAIQIAGTAMPAQLPFFVAACDYTLIGEELFAASAYLSREPKLLGSLKGQDFGKAVFLIAIIIGVILESFGIPFSKFFMAH